MSLRISENEPLAPYTTFQTGGSARWFARVSTVEDVREAIMYVKKNNIHLAVLGGGSNIVVADTGVPCLVIKNEIRGISADDSIRVGSGESWDGFVDWSVKHGFWGIENLSAIPGTVGAAPVQNIGAYGTEVQDVIESVEAIDMRSGDLRVFSKTECQFGYRHSFFKTVEGKNFLIVAVHFKLSSVSKPNLSYKDLQERFVGKNEGEISLEAIRQAVIDIRKGKFPDLDTQGTAGSFWKNPIISERVARELKETYPDIPLFPAGEDMVKISLAWILDHVCGLKGYTEGSVALYKKQPLVLVVERGASSSDIDVFACRIEARVKEKTGIEIEREVNSFS